MFSTVFVALLGIGHLATSVPLEHPSEDLSQYFDSRIVGGSLAKEGEVPHMVGLLVGPGHGISSLVCGGSLISPRHICTAAHCTDSFIDWTNTQTNNVTVIPSFHGVIGTNQWNNKNGILFSFANLKQHPQYNPWTYKNDIAILTTNDLSIYGTNIKPISLHFGKVEGGVKCSVAGWGTERVWGPTPDDLKILEMHIFDSAKCVEVVKANSIWGPQVDPELEICTLHSVGHGMCHGDSGSGLVLSDIGELIGLVAWGFPCARGLPDIFTRMTPHRGFIESAMH